MILWADTETFCEVPIKNGTHAYAEQAEVIVSAWAEGDGPVRVEAGLHVDFIHALARADQIVFHNLRFDRTVLRHQGVDLPLDKCLCTMAQARAHSLPGSLGQLCEILGVPTDAAKDKAGKQLIQLFCKPQPKNRELRRATAQTHPVEWQRFLDYAGSDILAMREVHKRMPKWNYPNNPKERALWQLDHQINDRGFAVDTDLATAAIEAVAREQKRLAKDVQDHTNGAVDSATQRDKMLAHLLEEYGVTLPDMQKGTLERRVNDPDLPLGVRELIAMRLEASGTAVAKYKTLLAGVSSDGRLRGGLEWCGAARTGRWSGRLFQPQNLPRPKHKPQEVADSIEAIKSGIADLVYDDVMARASSAIRGVIVPAEGKNIVAADLSNIEGRVLAWLAGEEWKLKAFREFDAGIGPDLYILAYSKSFNVPVAAVTKDDRQIGKVQELALGYQGAVGAFASMAAIYGVDLPEEKILEIVKAWRAAHRQVVSFWYGLEDVCKKAVVTPNVRMEFRKLAIDRVGAWLRIKLPSGRLLCYPSPKIDEDGRLSYMGVNQYTRKWQRIDTYGGKLVENVTQAVARDVMAEGIAHAEAQGFDVVLTVHDELVTEATASWEDLAAILSTNPDWAPDLPLAAAGFTAERYGKYD